MRLIPMILILASSAFAHAQQSTWPLQSKPNGILAIDLVTIAQPAIRHKCRVHTITEDAITCGIGPLRKPLVYPRETVAALILPPTHAHQITSWILVAAAAAAIYLSLSIPITAVAVFIQVIASMTALAPIFAIASEDHSNDILLYQRSRTPLIIPLH